jgi:ABC-2 type transport system permease protein
MKHILCKILLHNKTHPVVAASFMIIGAYIGYLIWYILDSYLPAAAADNGYVFVSLISVWLCAFWGIYQLPDQLCMNRRIKMILCYPVEAQTIVSVVAMRIFILQSGICAAFLYPFFLFEAHRRREAVLAMLFCCILTGVMDIGVILFSILLSRFCAYDIVGYAFVVFQYGSFLVLAWLAGNVVFALWGYIAGKSQAVPKEQELHVALWVWAVALLGLTVLIMALRFAAEHWYVRGYLNVQDFRHREAGKRPTTSHITHPYFLLEWKRVTRNKELIFFSNIKNMITVMILSRLLFYNFSQIGLTGTYVEELFQGFLWGEITVFLFWSILICLERLPVLSAFLLLLYGTSMNYVCSWLGVLIDLKMPRTVNSTNELLHGNISKVLVLITATILAVGEIFLSSRKWLPVPLLPFACLAGAGVAAGEICFWRFCKGVFYDTDS